MKMDKKYVRRRNALKNILAIITLLSIYVPIFTYGIINNSIY